MANNQQLNAVSHNNDETYQDESSDDECYRRARPISHYRIPPAIQSIYMQQIPNNNDEVESDGQHSSDFDDSQDSVPKRPSYSELTWNVALQDHEEVDYDEKVNMTNEDGSCKNTLALANQKTICLAPLRCSKERWPKTNKKKFNERIVSVLNAFRNSKYTKKTYKERSINLVITDSLMSSIPFEKIYQNTVKLFVGYPNDPFQVIEQMKQQIKNKENDYIIKNILLCIGFDSLVYYPNINQATKDTNKFLNQFLNVIKKAFAQNGPKRYKYVNFEEDQPTPIPIQPPKIIIVNIPSIANHPTAFTYNLEIEKMNKAISKYVASSKDFAFKKHNIDFELYDWAKFASTYPQCNTNDLRERNRILTVDLAEQFTWLMIPRSTENPSALQQDQAEAQVRRELMENNNIPQENNNKQKKTISYSEPLTSFVSDESSDFEMEASQVDESQNSQDSIIDEENNSMARKLRKRKSSSNNIHPLEKQPKRTSQRRGESSSDSFESDDDEVSKEVNSSLTILDPSKYKLRHYDDGKICIFVFASKEKNTCYEFTKSSKYYYRCLGCLEKGKYVCVYLLEDETIDKYSVFTKDGHEHCCTPREYDPERFSKKFIYSSNFNFFREKNSLKAVYFDDEKKFCYKFSYQPSSKIFVCCQCRLIKKEIVILKRCRNDEGEEYLSPGSKKHICKPLKYAEVISNMELLSSSDIDFDKEKITVEEERQKPDPRFFDIQKNDKGNPQLIVYTSSEKLQWYKYYYEKSRDIFFCSKCTGQGRFITAKYVEKDSTNDEGYVTLGESEHICEPLNNDVKFVRKIVKGEELDKELYHFEKNKKGKPQLFIYTSKEKRQGYKYIRHYKDKFRCTGCYAASKRKYVFAQLIRESPNDDGFITLGETEHVCEPLSVNIVE